ncbi:MAG TPA: DUF6350 family protein [Pseudonocardiaceae bacterium]|nr:DUF6350 family protein [Pseudonocardiaceae bacterium]
MPTLQSVPRPAAPGRAGRADRPARVLLVAAVGSPVAGYAGIAAVLALVTATAPGATLSTGGVLRAAGPAWLAVHHVPVSIAGHELGVLPLLPTIGVLALVARSAGNAARRLEWDTPRGAAKVIGTVGAAHGVFGLLVALPCLGWTVTAPPVVAFFVAGLLAAFAAAVGTARQCGLLAAVLSRADGATEAGLRAGRLALVALAVVGALVFAIGLVGSLPTVVRLFGAAAPGAGGGLGMALLCLAYLPNVLIGALSFAAGPGFSVGSFALAQWRFHDGPLPAVPVLGPLPDAVGDWWVFLMLLPLAVGVLVGLVCRRFDGLLTDRLRAVGVAALMAGAVSLVAAALAGGALAGGPFDPVTVPAGSLGVAVCLLIGVPAAVTVRVAGRAEPEPVVEDDFEDEPEPDSGPSPA